MNKYPWYYWFSLLWTLPWNICAWFVVLFMRVCAGGELFWRHGLWLSLKENGWFVNKLYKKWEGTTFGNGGILRKKNVGDIGIIDTKTEFHESVHEEQFEVVSLMSFSMFGICMLFEQSLWYLIPMWFSGYPAMFFCGRIQARLRGENPYYGSQHEESAYAQTIEYIRQKEGM